MDSHQRLLRRAPRFAHETTTVRAVSGASMSRPAVVQTDGGAVTARWVFDSRRPVATGGTRMVFRGFEIETDRPLPDPETVTLLDFRVPQSDTVRFAYLLPLGPQRAVVDLVELVSLDHDLQTAGTQPDSIHTALLEGYLHTVQGLRDFAVLRTEHDSLPLRPVRSAHRRSGRVMAIGRAGGLLRASTGFAFDRIQRDSVALTESLVNHDHPGTGWRPPRRQAWLDRVFLQVATDDPAQLEAAMSRLFRGASAAVPLAFLDGDSTLRQEAGLIGHLPYRPFLRAALAPRTYLPGY